MKIYTPAEMQEKETIESLLKKYGIVETARLGNMSYLTLANRMRYLEIPNIGRKNSGRKKKVFDLKNLKNL